MATTTRTPTTAHGLLALVEPLGPAVENEDLVFDADPPADVDPLLRVLHTGVRALVVGKRWYGCDGTTGRVSELNPGVPIPAGITLLAVEGDGRWDRIDPAARLDHPHLFARDPTAGPSRAGQKRPPHRERP
ncbi:unnamed protein product [uncultured bacterium]|nr:unnamed protein product [uncultured bacterium]